MNLSPTDVQVAAVEVSTPVAGADATVAASSAPSTAVLRQGAVVNVPRGEALLAGDRVVTGPEAVQVLVPNGPGNRQAMVEVAPNSEVVVRPASIDPNAPPVDLLVVAGDAAFVEIVDPAGQPIVLLKKSASAAVAAGGFFEDAVGPGLLAAGLLALVLNDDDHDPPPPPPPPPTLTTGVDRVLAGAAESGSSDPLPALLSNTSNQFDAITSEVDILFLGPELEGGGALDQTDALVQSLSPSLDVLGGTAVSDTVNHLVDNLTDLAGDLLATDVLDGKAQPALNQALETTDLLVEQLLGDAGGLLGGSTNVTMVATLADQLTDVLGGALGPVVSAVDSSALGGGGALGGLLPATGELLSGDLLSTASPLTGVLGGGGLPLDALAAEGLVSTLLDPLGGGLTSALPLPALPI
ncbi:hypothetical protein JI742_08195 [Piscinibacter sp. Jin2]|uniref:Uncharacterized protein n=1 Tax=Aquariibacter lacus TaxID=2801332 RepID=A0A9X1BRR2_9BURK|nr:hypothetical protein [Piscinibacter lacus]MBL0719868.1 hypothetical protein [Piscinibacter lacus]